MERRNDCPCPAGESFGMACAEFSVLNKPIITFKNGSQPEFQKHIDILGHKGIYYHDSISAVNAMLNLNTQKYADWNAYKEYLPEKVIKKFEKVFLD